MTARPLYLPTLFLTFVLSLVALAAAQSGPVGSWQGAIGPGVLDLGIRATFETDGPELHGTLDIPAQGLFDFPLSEVAWEDDRIAFAMAGVPGDPRFEGTIVGDRIEGDFTQGGQTLAFELSRLGPDVADARPQEPRPPFPYFEEEVVLGRGEIELAGTLTLPEGDARVPALVLVSGSGSQDRNQEILGHKPFLLLADRLTRAGYGVLRVDDRGVGGSGGRDADADFADLVGDVHAALDHLAAHPRVDASSLGILGHSQGGYLAPVVATERDDVAFVILMAGPATDGFEVLLRQNELLIERILRDQGAPDDVIDAAIESQLEFLNDLRALLSEDDLDGAGERIRDRIEEEFAAVPEAQRPPPDALESLVAEQRAATTAPAFRAFLDHDPEPFLRRLEASVLALFGELDFQVDPEQNAGPMRDALADAPTNDVTVVTLAGLNHLMQPAETGLLAEYGAIEITLAEPALDAIVSWLQERFPAP